MTNSHELSRLSLDFEEVLVVVVVATTCTTYSRANYWSSFKERTREVRGGSRWTGIAQHLIGYKNLFWPIRSKIYKSLWNCSSTNSWPGALPLLFFFYLTLPPRVLLNYLTYRKRQLITDVVLICIHVIPMCFKFAKDNSIVDITFTK